MTLPAETGVQAEARAETHFVMDIDREVVRE